MKRIVVAAVVITATPVLAQTPSAEEYYPGCAAVAGARRWSEVPPAHRAAAKACLGAVAVVLFEGRMTGICPPAPIAQPEAAAVVAHHLGQNPDLLKEPFRSVARDALAEEFPCGPGR